MLFSSSVAISQNGTLIGGTESMRRDIYIINDDESKHDAAIRLQSKNANTFRDWLIFNEQSSGNLHFGFWSGLSHPNSIEKDYDEKLFSFKRSGILTAKIGGELGIAKIGSRGNDLVIRNTALNSDLVVQKLSGRTTFSSRQFDYFASDIKKLTLASNKINLSGPVGINMPSQDPKYALDVVGTINASEFRINGNLINLNGNILSAWEPVNNDIKFIKGNVGIGKAPSTNFKLEVDGKMFAKEADLGSMRFFSSQASDGNLATHIKNKHYEYSNLIITEGGQINLTGDHFRLFTKQKDDYTEITPGVDFLPTELPDRETKIFVHDRAGINLFDSTTIVGNTKIKGVDNGAYALEVDGKIKAEDIVLTDGTTFSSEGHWDKIPNSNDIKFSGGNVGIDKTPGSNIKLDINGTTNTSVLNTGNAYIGIGALWPTKFTFAADKLPLLQVSGGANVTGIFGVEGGANILGAFGVEGYSHFTGSVEIGGNPLSEFNILNPLKTVEDYLKGGLKINGNAVIGTEGTWGVIPDLKGFISTLSGSYGQGLHVNGWTNINGLLQVGHPVVNDAEFTVHGVSKINGPLRIKKNANLLAGALVDAPNGGIHASGNIQSENNMFAKHAYFGPHNASFFGVLTGKEYDWKWGNQYRLIVNGNLKAEKLHIGSIGKNDKWDSKWEDATRDYTVVVDRNLVARKIGIVSDFKTFQWPDYVFEEDYQLESLETVEAFIKEKNHLPNIPSAEELKGKDIDILEMNAKLLEKIEELTLHAIDQNKRIKKLEEQLNKH